MIRIVLRSGVILGTPQRWSAIKREMYRDPDNPEFVIQVFDDDGKPEWASIRKDNIDAFLGIVED